MRKQSACLAISASILALCLGAGPATAQEATTAQDETEEAPQALQDDADSGDQLIVVTGSRIRRPDFQAPNPVVSLDSEALQASGTTNITDFLQGYPALIGSSTSADNSGSGAGIGATGLNLLNLRNLGTARTLVLVDGRRHVAGVPGSQAIDVNTIPTDLVERIEVLTGGASAIYGADGVTGVVNFILKKDFEGISARAQAGISEYGDAGQRLASITVGKNFLDGRGNVALAYEYGKDDRLETRDRRRLRGTNLYGFYLNPDDAEAADNNNDGIPDYIPLNNIRYFDTNRQGGIDLDFDGFPDYFVGPNGQLVAFDGGTFIPDFYQQGGNATLVSDYGNDLLPDVERNVVNFLGHIDIAPAVSLFAEAKYARVESYSLGQPTFDYYMVIEPDNAFIPEALRPTVEANGGALLNRDNFDFGQRGEAIERETYRGVIGLRGDISPDLNYEVSYVYGKSKIKNRYVNDILDDRFYAALDAVIDPATGQATCRVNLDPAWSPNQPFNYTRDIFDPTTFQPGECVPLNLFGEGVASQEALDFIRVNTTDRSSIEQQVVSAVLTGDLGGLFTLPGGDVGFAIGAEYRTEKSTFTPDEIAAQGLTFTNALAVQDGKYNVKELFGEIRVPLLSDRPFVHRLEFGGAVRLSDYSTIGGTTTWKVDGTFAPVRDVTFNGTYSKAVRAPNIGELFSGNSQTFQFITDPCNINQIQNGSEFRAQNCSTLLASLGADPTTYRDSRSSNISGFQGGNPNLKEESATTWTAGVVIEPRFLPGLSLRADWYDIKLKDAINSVQSEQLAELCVDQATLDNPFCDAITRQNGAAGIAEAGNIIGFQVGPQNVAQFRTAGLDVNMNYRIPTDDLGTFNLKVVGNYLDRLEFIGTPGAPVTDSRGEAFAPKYQVNTDLSWQKGSVMLNYGLSWFDKTLRFSNQEVAGNPDIVAPKYLYYKERWQHDIYGSVDVTEGFQFYGGVNNLFGQRPDIGANTYPISSVGRFFYAGARVKFDRIGF